MCSWRSCANSSRATRRSSRPSTGLDGIANDKRALLLLCDDAALGIEEYTVARPVFAGRDVIVVTEAGRSDNLAAGQLAAEHLIGLGHKRIGMLAGHLGLSPHHDRLEGFRKAMQEAHLPILDEYLIAGNVQVEDGIGAGRRLLGLSAPPTAILASNNKLLLGVLQAVEEKNLSIPKDLSVLGFDECFQVV